MTAMKLHRYPSASGGVAFGKIGAGVKLARRLPYDAEVEYLESTGTQWIDTGVLIEKNDRVDCTFSLLEYGNAMLAGARTSSSHDSFAIWAYTLSERRIRFDYFSNAVSGSVPLVTSTAPALGQDYVASKVGERNFVDGVEVASNGASSNYTPRHSCYLFAMNNGGSASFIGKVRIKRFSISGKCDFIPVRVGNVGYMYDRVSGRLFGNEGTGAFPYGNDIQRSIPL